MKNIFIVSALLMSPLSFAGAKLSIKPQYFLESQKLGVTAGLSVYQKLVQNIAINVWSGIGYRPSPLNSRWYGANADVDVMLNEWTVSPGFQWRASPGLQDDDNSIGVKVAYKIW